jgi:hypothetical protein
MAERIKLGRIVAPATEFVADLLQSRRTATDISGNPSRCTGGCAKLSGGTVRERAVMFTHNLVFGMNLISLAGFAVMGIALAMQRQQKLGAPAVFGLMTIGTVLLFVGFYLYVP